MDEMDNNLSDGLSCTVHQGPAELYQEGFTELGWSSDRCVRLRVVFGPPGWGLDES